MVNCDDPLTARTGGYIKSGLHRVHDPPKERFILIGLRCWFFRSMSATDSYFDGNMLKKDILRANSDVIMGVDQE